MASTNITPPLPAQPSIQNPGVREDEIMKRVFLSPAVIILLVLSIFPLLWSLGISFTDMQRGGSTAAREAAAAVEAGEEPESVGLLGLGFEVTGRNYARMVDDGRLHVVTRNTMFYVFAGVIVQYIIGFGLATVLNQQFMGRNIARVIFLLPMMTTPVAAAYLGRMMFDTNRSPLADLTTSLLGSAAKVPWMTDTFWAPITILIIDSWQWIPFMTLLLLAGMQSIPDEIYEAARVDGANSFHLLKSITFPILLPLSITVILIRGLEIFKIMDIIYITTGGGPGSATESLTMYIFEMALTAGNYGYAAAVSFALLVMVIIFATVFLVFGRRMLNSSSNRSKSVEAEELAHEA